MFNDGENKLVIEIEPHKQEKIKAWCQKNNTSISELVNQLIDSCLSGKDFRNNQISPQREDETIEQKINLMIQKSISPLKQRIKSLEREMNCQSSASSETLVNSPNSNQEISLQQEDPQEEISEKRQYLTRHQVWEILKKTNYVKTNGYESFLRATPEELQPYNIYYDRILKRYYLIETEDLTEKN
jgi:hypothetical protein